MTFRLRPLALALAIGVALAAPLSAEAQDYPTKPIKWLLGYGAGGASDVIARTIAMKLTGALGQPVLIDNRPGASGIIADDDRLDAVGVESGLCDVR